MAEAMQNMTAFDRVIVQVEDRTFTEDQVEDTLESSRTTTQSQRTLE